MTASSEWFMKEHQIDGEGEMSVANTNNMIWSKEKSVIVNMVTSPQTSLLPVYISGYWGRRGGGVLEQQDEGDDDIVLMSFIRAVRSP